MNNIEARIKRLERELERQKEMQKKLYDHNCTTIGERIMKEITIKGITQGKLAKELGITRQSIGNYISGKRSIRAEILGKIAKILDVTCDYLIYGDEEE